MPWNCLCSSKEKRKLEISAPIINIEDSSNQQLVPSLKPRPFVLSTSEIKTSKYLNNNNNQNNLDKSILKNDPQNSNGINKKSKKSKNCKNQSIISSAVTENSSDNSSKSGKKLKKQKNLRYDEKKLLKQQQKEQKLIKKTFNNGIVNGSHEKITKQLANVKFSFDKSTTPAAPDTEELCENKSNVCINAATCYENDTEIRSSSPALLLCTTNNVAITAALVDNNKINENVTNVDRVQQDTQIEQQQQYLHQQEKKPLERITTENNAGNYDEISFVQNENFTITKSYTAKSSSSVQELRQPQQEINQVKCDNSTETDSTIPFNEEELHLFIQKNIENSSFHHKNIVDNHNARFITIHPQNIGSFQTITNAIIPTVTEPNYKNGSLTVMGDEQTENDYFDNQRINFELNKNIMVRDDKNFLVTTTTKMPATSAALLTNDIPQTFTQPTTIPVEHDFQSWKIIKGKLCQLCHESLLKKPSCIVKCRSCDLICHNWCATAMPSIRYHDTSYIINRKWLRGGDELTFPIVHHFVNSDAKIRSENNKIDNNNKLFHYATDNENDKSLQQQRRRNNHKDKPRRRTRSLEKRKRPLSAVQQDIYIVETSDDEELIKKKIKENLITINDDKSQSEHNKEKNSDEIVRSCGTATTNVVAPTHQNLKDDQNNNKNKVIHLCHERVIRLEIIEKPNKTESNVNNQNESQQENNENSTEESNLVVSDKNELQIPEIIETKSNYDKTKLDTMSSTSTTLTNRNYSQNVVVDVHRRPDSVASSNLSSEVLIINENNSSDDDEDGDVDNNKNMTKDIDSIPKFNQQRIVTNVGDNDKTKRNSRSSDSSDKTITQEQLVNVNLKNSTTNTNEITTSNDKPIILSGKRFFYIQGTSNSSSGMSASSSSTINDMDEDSSMDDYEQVDLRRSATSQSLPVQSSHQSLPKKPQ